MESDRDDMATTRPVDQPDEIEEFDPDFEDVAADSPLPADEATESLHALVTFLVSHLVDDPEAVEILVDRRGSAVHVQLRMPEDDLGKVIGRGGRIAKAIRTVLLIAGSRHHLRVTLDIES